MKIVLFSGTYGKHSYVSIPICDILVCAGNFSLGGTINELTSFLRWFRTQPSHFKILVGGAYDKCLENYSKESPRLLEEQFTGKQGNYYLNRSSCIINGKIFYGSPYSLDKQGISSNFAFKFTRDEGKSIYKDVPVNTDVFITHGAPFGHLDLVPPTGEHIGSVDLSSAIFSTSAKYALIGQNQFGYGGIDTKAVTFYNGHICDNYKPINKPMVINI